MRLLVNPHPGRVDGRTDLPLAIGGGLVAVGDALVGFGGGLVAVGQTLVGVGGRLIGVGGGLVKLRS
jgi:hypothetical protein